MTGCGAFQRAPIHRLGAKGGLAIVGKSHSVSGGDSGIPADQVTPIKGVGRKPSVDYIAWADIDGMLQREKGATIHQLGEVRCVGVAN